ncbi:ABC transporter permease [Roseibium aggregatum]|uniref:Arginine ABC transporter permease protein ArtQ n=1 Tax=Roseibium aggregatum TaxID=187304 RepID=A0A0M6YBJ2_9HYPH|nr:ABC transporter permease subunit [Roseibium aggregatum]CTQ47455.1 Arginine ABC transporter permease protein ArtQ [Roseibium aggregatum]
MTELLALLTFGDGGWGDELLRGLVTTLMLAFVTAPFALILSFLIAWAKNSRNMVLRRFAYGYTTVFRSLPEVLTLLIIYYQFQALLNFVVGVFVPGVIIPLNAFAAGVIALTLVFSALGSEVVRSAYQAVGKGQAEAGAALGLRRRLIFFKVILPQMWSHSIPAFGNLWLILLKDTSLVSIIAINDLVRYSNMAIATTKEPFFFYSVIAGIFVALAYLSGLVQMRIERRTNLNLLGGR